MIVCVVIGIVIGIVIEHKTNVGDKIANVLRALKKPQDPSSPSV